jgi:hypothetical protein
MFYVNIKNSFVSFETFRKLHRTPAWQLMIYKWPPTDESLENERLWIAYVQAYICSHVKIYNNIDRSI